MLVKGSPDEGSQCINIGVINSNLRLHKIASAELDNLYLLLAPINNLQAFLIRPASIYVHDLLITVVACPCSIHVPIVNLK